jgi:hypothetical protein
MKIKVLNIKLKKDISVECEKEETINDLKIKLSLRTQIPIEKQQLFLNGEV